MSGWAGWTNAENTRLVGLALLHFLWQGVALGALAFLVMSMVQRASARYLAGVFMLALMVAAPAATFFVLTQRHDDSQGKHLAVANPSGLLESLGADGQPSQPVAKHGVPVPAHSSSGYLMWLVEAWFLGVALLSLRPAAGFLLIERMRARHGSPVNASLLAQCQELQRRMGLRRMVRFCESLQVQAPAVAGWFRPVVLLPMTALTGLTPGQLAAVIAHELAHVKRYDAFVNVFQMAAETLLFYHPAVWWLSKRIREEREHCCDDVAIAVCGNSVEYARALAAMAEWHTAPALAMAANRSPLAGRVARLLGAGRLQGGLRGAGVAFSALCLSVSLLAGNALVHAGRPVQDPAVEAQSAAQPAVATPARSAVADARPVLAGESSGAIEIRMEDSLAKPVIEPDKMYFPQREANPGKESRRQGASEISQAQQEPSEAPPQAERPEHRDAGHSSYIEGLKAVGLTNLSIDQLIALKIQGVTPEYVHGIRDAGLKPDVDELVAMKIQGVTPELVRSMRESGLATEIGDIIAMRVQGVTPEYVKQLHDAGVDADGGKILAMKIQGVSPEYIREMRAASGVKLPADELIGMKIQDVTPDYVRQMKALGLEMDPGEIIGLKVQDVTPGYVKAMQAAGLKMDAHEVMGAKVQGLTPEFVNRARQHGFQNLDLHKLLALKNSGVLDE